MAVENLCFDSMSMGYFGTQPQPQPDWYSNPTFGIQEMHNLDHSSGIIDDHQSSDPSFAHSLVSDIEKHMKELDWYLHWENKRLRRSILQESKRQQAMILQKYDSVIRTLMVQKEEEIAAARMRTRELQDMYTTAEMKAKAWEKRAREKEAMVTELSKKLNEVRVNKEDDGDDAVSFVGSSSGGGEGEDCNSNRMMMMTMEMGMGIGMGMGLGMACKLCQARNLCVVFLPCKHLCCCNFCDSLLGQCPICQTVKEASLEVCLG